MNMFLKKGQSSHLLQGFNHLQQQNIPFWYMKKTILPKNMVRIGNGEK